MGIGQIINNHIGGLVSELELECSSSSLLVLCSVHKDPLTFRGIQELLFHLSNLTWFVGHDSNPLVLDCWCCMEALTCFGSIQDYDSDSAVLSMLCTYESQLTLSVKLASSWVDWWPTTGSQFTWKGLRVFLGRPKSTSLATGEILALGACRAFNRIERQHV